MQLIPGFQKLDISKVYNTSCFSCGIQSFDSFLTNPRNGLLKLQEKKILQGYVLTTNDPVPEIMGYYTLSGGSFEKGLLSKTQQRRFPYTNMPCILLGKLALDVRIQKKGFGELLIIDAAQKVYEISSSVGVYALFVEAFDDKAAEFYLSMGFIEAAKDSGKRTFLYPVNQFDRLLGNK